MSAVTNNNWYNLNSTRKYPLDDGCTGVDDAGNFFPATAIEDINISLKKSLGVGVMVSSFSATKSLVSVTFLGYNHPINHSLYDTPPTPLSFMPLAVLTLKKPVRKGTPYAITPLVSGIAGWVVFGEGIDKTINCKFTSPSQSSLAPKVCRYYNDFPVTSVGKVQSADKLTGLIKLVGGRDVSITKEFRNIQGEEKQSVVFSLLENTTNNVFTDYSGPCGGRPESGTCGRLPIEYLNTVQPDCNGNININFVSPFLSASGGIGRFSLEYPVGLNEACTRADRLPNSDGKLPGEYTDFCNPSSEPDPDANLPKPEPTLPQPIVISSSTIDYTGLPACIGFNANTAQSWQVLKGRFDISDTDSPMEICPTIIGSGSSSEGPGPSSSFAIYDYGAYMAKALGDRNISVWYNPAYTSTLNKRIITDINLPWENRNTIANGGVVLNYRANSEIVTDEYYFVEINRKESAFAIKKFNGAFFVEVASAKELGIALNGWYRIKTEVTPGTAGKTRIDAYLYIVNDEPENPITLIAYINCEVSDFAPYTGKVGLCTNRSEALFSFFAMEEI